MIDGPTWILFFIFGWWFLVPIIVSFAWMVLYFTYAIIRITTESFSACWQRIKTAHGRATAA